MLLHNIKACVFDAYGTLFDFGSAVRRSKAIPADKVDPLIALWRDKQLQYTWLRAVQGRHADFWQVTGDALDYSLETLGLLDGKLRDQLMRLYLTLETFPEVPAVLDALKSSRFKLAILSNGSPEMLAAIVQAAKLANHFDAVLSVEEVGVFKPHPKVYQLALDRLGLPAQAISFQSSNAWDAYAASAFGMRVAWCNRLPGSRSARCR